MGIYTQDESKDQYYLIHDIQFFSLQRKIECTSSINLVNFIVIIYLRLSLYLFQYSDNF